MANDFMNMITDGGRLTCERLQELNEINTKTFNRLARVQLNFASLGIENSVEQARLFTGAGKHEDLLSAESDLASAYSDRFVELAREATDIISESRDELMTWMEKRFEEGSKKAAAVSESKPKPASKKAASKSGQGQQKVA